MPVDLDMIVGCDAATLPARKNVWLVRQFSQLRLVDLDEEFGAAGAKTAHLAGVEFDDKPANGGIELRQRKEAVIAQSARTQRCAIWTATSTFALSFGRLGLAARMAVP